MKQILYIIIGVMFLSCGKRQEYVDALEQLQAQNKAFVPFTSDSLAKDVVSYFDRHGSSNEQMKAHYLLGCVYRDLGESPCAVDCYLDAINKADTTAKDCDFYLLSTVYSQMANIYYKQLLLSNEIEARHQASHYAFRADSIYFYILNLESVAGSYILMNKKDKAMNYLQYAMASYHKNGYKKDELRTTKTLIYLYTCNSDSNNLLKAKKLIDKYETEFDLSNDNKELPLSERQYYYYKGRYYGDIGNLDSAEVCFRKVYRPNMSYTAQNSMYKGLLSVFQKRHISDSIAKYAQLYCEANDSSIAKKDQELTAQMAASYNYSLYQKEAIENESKTNKTRMILLTFVFLVIISTILIWRKYQNIKRKRLAEIENLKTEHVRATDEYSRNLYTMQLLDKSRQQDIASMQKDSLEYENKMTELKEENQRLEKAIKRIEQQKGISQYLENTIGFMRTDIVRHLKDLDYIPLSTMNEKDWRELDKQVREYFPHLLLDLHNSPKITTQKIQVCLLVIIKVSDSSISNWLGLKASRISNIKSELNKTLFGENSARSLYNNLRQKYNIISSVQ